MTQETLLWDYFYLFSKKLDDNYEAENLYSWINNTYISIDSGYGFMSWPNNVIYKGYQNPLTRAQNEGMNL